MKTIINSDREVTDLSATGRSFFTENWMGVFLIANIHIC